MIDRVDLSRHIFIRMHKILIRYYVKENFTVFFVLLFVLSYVYEGLEDIVLFII